MKESSASVEEADDAHHQEASQSASPEHRAINSLHYERKRNEKEGDIEEGQNNSSNREDEIVLIRRKKGGTTASSSLSMRDAKDPAAHYHHEHHLRKHSVGIEHATENDHSMLKGRKGSEGLSDHEHLVDGSGEEEEHRSAYFGGPTRRRGRRQLEAPSGPGAHHVEGRAFGEVPEWERQRGTARSSSGSTGSLVGISAVAASGASLDATATMGTHETIASVAADTPGAIVPEAKQIDDAEPIVTATNIESEVKRKRKCLAVAIVIVFAIATAVITSSVLLTRNNESDSVDNNEQPGPKDPCQNVSQTDLDIVMQCQCFSSLVLNETNRVHWAIVVDVLTNENLVPPGFNETQDITSCQEVRNLAIHWLVEAFEIDTEERALAMRSQRVPTIFFVQYYVLVVTYLSMNGDSWERKEGWLESNKASCSWFGVTCTPTGRAMELNLASNNCSGSLPSELGELTFLKRLILADNPGLRGSAIPSELYSIGAIRTIDLRNNGLIGQIQLPKEGGNRSIIDNLILSNNSLTGTLPTELGDLIRLRRLRLDFNKVEGPIPSELGQMTNVEDVVLSFNRLNSTIPFELTRLKYLETLELRNNSLSGLLPPDFNSTWRLLFLDFAHNDLQGENLAGSYCVSLKYLDTVFLDCSDFDEVDETPFAGPSSIFHRNDNINSTQTTMMDDGKKTSTICGNWTDFSTSCRCVCSEFESTVNGRVIDRFLPMK